MWWGKGETETRAGEMSSPKSNSRSQTAGLALGQAQTLLVGSSTSAGSTSPRLPQVPSPRVPGSERRLPRRHRAGAGGRGRPFKGARGVVTRRGVGAQAREDDAPGRPTPSSQRRACGRAARSARREPRSRCGGGCSLPPAAAGLPRPPTPHLPSPRGSGRWSMGTTGTRPRSSSKRQRRNGARGLGFLQGFKTGCGEGGTGKEETGSEAEGRE